MKLTETTTNMATEMANSNDKNTAIIIAITEASYQAGYDYGISKGCKLAGIGVAMGMIVSLVACYFSNRKVKTN